MSDGNLRTPMVHVAKIIRLALIMGVVVFGLIVHFVVKPEKAAAGPGEFQVPMVTLVAMGFSILTFVMRFIVLAGMKPAVSKQQLEATPEDQQPGLFYGIWQTRTIIEGAIWEGAAFMCIAAYMIEGYTLPLMFAAALVICMLATMPTQGRFDSYVYDQTQRIRNSFE